MILRDPVHGLVAFETEEESIVERLLEAKEMQRLRRIQQLGLASLAYPGAHHTRFAHAVGAAFVMSLFLRRMRALHGELPFWQRVTTERAREALAAALLHDVGHGPFSHLFEEALPDGHRHEEWTRRIVLESSTEVNSILKSIDPSLPKRVAELIAGRHELTFLAKAVSGAFDVDRCDYLLRDAHATGVSYGRYDLDWLLRSLRLGITDSTDSPPLAIDGTKGLPAIESFILARLFMFQQVYFHKASRSSEWLLSRIMGRVRELLNDGRRLPVVPPALQSLAVTGDAPLEDYLELDDATLWNAIAAWGKSSDPVLSDLAQRLRTRKLFKTIELYGDQAAVDRRELLLLRAQEIAAAAGLHPEVYVGMDCASITAFDMEDDPLMVIFPDGTRRKPADVSFLLSRLRGETMERVRLLFAPELREPIEAAVRRA